MTKPPSVGSARPMGLWPYRHEADGIFSRLPVATFDRWVHGEAGLPHDGSGFVRYVVVGTHTEERRHIAVWMMEFSKQRVDRRGRCHTERLLREAVQVLDLAHSGKDRPTSGPANLVDATGAFQLKRLQARWHWRPSKADLQALSELINKRAGRELMRAPSG